MDKTDPDRLNERKQIVEAYRGGVSLGQLETDVLPPQTRVTFTEVATTAAAIGGRFNAPTASSISSVAAFDLPDARSRLTVGEVLKLKARAEPDHWFLIENIEGHRVYGLWFDHPVEPKTDY